MFNFYDRKTKDGHKLRKFWLPYENMSVHLGSSFWDLGCRAERLGSGFSFLGLGFAFGGEDSVDPKPSGCKVPGSGFRIPRMI